MGMFGSATGWSKKSKIRVSSAVGTMKVMLMVMAWLLYINTGPKVIHE